MKLGIVGTGNIVNDVLTFIDTLPEIELVHISGTKRSEEKVKQMCNDNNFKRYSTEYKDLLNDDEVDTIYVALPNQLHYEYTKLALENGKHVIIEKPFTSNVEEAIKLVDLAKAKNLFLWEAITNQFLPNFYEVKKYVKQLGDIKIIECNYSQYSSRYDAFLEGDIKPAFDIKQCGGALVDLNMYNVYFVVGIFGKPKNVEYYPNIDKGIDTSGILIMDYGDFKAVCIGAKDSVAPMSSSIQGNKGCINSKSALNRLDDFQVIMNNGEQFEVSKNGDVHKMYAEFKAFYEMYKNNDYQECYANLDKSLDVMEVLTVARRKAGIIYDSDMDYIKYNV